MFYFLFKAPVFSAYIISAYFCSVIHAEYQNFVEKRMKYLMEGDIDTVPQTYYTLLLERLPPSLRSASALRSFLEDILPGIFLFIYL